MTYSDCTTLASDSASAVLEVERPSLGVSPRESDAAQLLELIKPSLAAIKKVSNWSDEAAKTLLYYAIATHGLEELSVFPILVVEGVPGSGKSTTMELMWHMVSKPVWLPTKPTEATLRDKFGNNTTAFGDEGEKIRDCILDTV